ncbi:LEM-3-like GIY-YIG domain-containing protein [Dietzia sp.]|uniref:LEM-3-like GIY-YIG domain-containing protein n=1 Tax=Dietzia sp. TaxID=1871616 RepID=UPI002FDB2DBC
METADKFDEELDAAWSAFTADSARLIASIERDEMAIFEFDMLGERVSSVVVNEPLDGFYQVDLLWEDERWQHGLGRREAYLLMFIGWDPPEGGSSGVPHWHYGAPVGDEFDLAELIKKTLRSIFGVPHPVFLNPDDVPHESRLVEGVRSEPAAIHANCFSSHGQLVDAVCRAVSVEIQDLDRGSDVSSFSASGRSGLAIRLSVLGVDCVGLSASLGESPIPQAQCLEELVEHLGRYADCEFTFEGGALVVSSLYLASPLVVYQFAHWFGEFESAVFGASCHLDTLHEKSITALGRGGEEMSDPVEEPVDAKQHSDEGRLPNRFPPGVAEKLGTYVYALRDPRTSKIFYVGKGNGERVYQHVWAARGNASAVDSQELGEIASHDGAETTSRKNEKINEIYDADNAVDHVILRHRIEPGENPDDEALAIEHVLIRALREHEGGEFLTNVVEGHSKTENSSAPVGELIALYSARPLPRPLPERGGIVVINRAWNWLLSGKEEDRKGPDGMPTTEAIFDAAKQYWKVGADTRESKDVPIFVVAGNVVRAVFTARSWKKKPYSRGHKTSWEFDGEPTEEFRDFIGCALTPADVGRTSWRQHGWHPIRPDAV